MSKERNMSAKENSGRQMDIDNKARASDLPAGGRIPRMGRRTLAVVAIVLGAAGLGFAGEPKPPEKEVPKGKEGTVTTIPADGSGGQAAFAWRDDESKKKLVVKNGGGAATESAVAAGLEWLKLHQEPEGFWDRKKYGGKTGATSDKDNVGNTGLAMLAFLAAGHTEKNGPHKDVVKKGTEWLIANQNEKGTWGTCGAEMWNMYNYQGAIGAMALSEAAGMTRNAALTAAAQKALDGLVAAQVPNGAWGYCDAKGNKDHTNDTSVTIWCAMALKSAKAAGLNVPEESIKGVQDWINFAQDLKYAKPGDNTYRGGQCYYRGILNKAASLRFSPEARGNTLTAAAGVIRVFWGEKLDHPGIVGPCNVLLEENLPGTGSGPGARDIYSMYYGTLLMFQKGGDHWQKWNKAMSPYLLGLIRKDGTNQDNKGSWDPVGGYAVPHGGRTMSTALGVLMLEVYYRYLPMYQPEAKK
jgi:hypothetical protein